MQPNEQNGLYQPDSNQPGTNIAPPEPREGVNPAELQAALDEPSTEPEASGATEELPPSGPKDPQNEEQSGEQFEEEAVTWTAHESIHQEKGALWFIIFTIVILGLIGVSVWTQAWSFTALIVIIAIVIIVYSRRPPRELTYSLTEEGLTVQDKLYKLEDFKSFGVIRDGEAYSVMLIPTQRFQPGVTVYFPEEAGEDIVDLLGERLPMKNLKLDAVDRAVRLLRL